MDLHRLLIRSCSLPAISFKLNPPFNALYCAIRRFVFDLQRNPYYPRMKNRSLPYRNLSFPVLATMTLLTPFISFAGDSWVELFDGQSLTGWKANENSDSFKVEDGCITNDGPRSHLFYIGEDGEASFENFELIIEALAKPGANSGVYFHTQYQDEGWPSEGFEVQINHSQEQHGTYLEMKKTGSLYGIRNLYKTMVPDDTWFELKVKVEKPRVRIWLDETLVVDFIEPARPLSKAAPALNALGKGTFAIQGHDPESHVYVRSIRVRTLPTTHPAGIAVESMGKTEDQILTLARDNFPLLDLHTHLKGGLELEHALHISRKTGLGLGIAVNGGKGFPVQNDAAALAFLESMQGQPVFVALQAEGREWTDMFSPEAIAKFDYVFTDSMTWTNTAGKRLRLWIPEESNIGDDVQAFMDELTEKAVEIISSEPIDIYVNPTYLPASIASDYDHLWTTERMQKVIDAAVSSHVAIEINGRFRLPSPAFLKLAKASGAKFTFGTNNAGAEDFGEWNYPLQMQKELGLSWQDMYVPGHSPSRSQQALTED